MRWTWLDATIYCSQTFGIYVNWEDRYFLCPECEEPILEEDWEDYDMDNCPVCETLWGDVE